MTADRRVSRERRMQALLEAARLDHLLDAAAPLALWWTMLDAHRELVGDPIPNESVVLHFMGSGASTSVTALDLRTFIAALDAAGGGKHAPAPVPATSGTCSLCGKPWSDHNFGAPAPYCP